MHKSKYYRSKAASRLNLTWRSVKKGERRKRAFRLQPAQAGVLIPARMQLAAGAEAGTWPHMFSPALRLVSMGFHGDFLLVLNSMGHHQFF